MKNSWVKPRVWPQASCFTFWVLSIGLSISLNSAGLAQIRPDSTLGSEHSTIQPNILINGSSSTVINGGAIRNTNLFHSFSEFNLAIGERAYFNNPIGVQAIFARITGNTSSQILGRLGVNGTANLFLINPNGIVFGPGSSLDVKGSFVATTADSILFPNGDRFSTNLLTPLPQASLLNINPSALSFSRQQTQPIRIQGNLSVPAGQSLLFVGGETTVNGARLFAPGGHLELAGLTTPGTIHLATNPLKISSISNENRANINISDSRLEVRLNGGGNANLYGQNIDINNGLIVAGISRNTTDGTVPQAGDIVLDSTGTVTITRNSNLFNGVLAADNGRPIVGNGGQIIIQAKNFSLQSGGQLNASVFGRGNAGDITLNIEESAVLGQTSGLRSLVQNGAVGDGGTIRVQAKNLVLVDGAQIATSVLGRGIGNGGSVRLNVTDSITIAGVDPQAVGTNGLPFPSGILVNNESNRPGNAGDIIVNTRRLTLADRAVIEAITTIGDGGNVQLRASEFILLRRGATISTTAGTIGAGGNGGNITIASPFVVAVLGENSDISANAFTGRGGNIAIAAQGIYGLKFQPKLTPFSDITASSQFGVSGNVTLNTPDVDPSKSLSQLSTVLVEPTDQIAVGCAPTGIINGTRNQSRFVVTGPGGVPATPEQDFGGDRPLVDLTQIPTEATQAAAQPQPPVQPLPPLIEAQGWIKTPDGTITLVANAQNAIAPPLGLQRSVACPQL